MMIQSELIGNYKKYKIKSLYDNKMSYVAKLCFHEELKGVELNDVKKVRKDLRQNAKGAGLIKILMLLCI